MVYSYLCIVKFMKVYKPKLRIYLVHPKGVEKNGSGSFLTGMMSVDLVDNLDYKFINQSFMSR